MGNAFGIDDTDDPSAVDDTDEGFKPTSRFYRQAGCFRAPFIQAFAFLDPLSLCRVEAVHQDLRLALDHNSSRNRLWRPHVLRAVDPFERDAHLIKVRDAARAHTPTGDFDFRLEYTAILRQRVASELAHVSGSIHLLGVDAYRAHIATRSTVAFVARSIVSLVRGGSGGAADEAPPTLGSADIALLGDAMAFDSPAVARAVALKRPAVAMTVVHRDTNAMLTFNKFVGALAGNASRQKHAVTLDMMTGVVEGYITAPGMSKPVQCIADLPSVASIDAPGFIDYAARIVRLRPEQEYLRDTVVWMMLRDLMVFETVEQGDAYGELAPDSWFAGLDHAGLRHHHTDAPSASAFEARHPDGYNGTRFETFVDGLFDGAHPHTRRPAEMDCGTRSALLTDRCDRIDASLAALERAMSERAVASES